MAALQNVVGRLMMLFCLLTVTFIGGGALDIQLESRRCRGSYAEIDPFAFNVRYVLQALETVNPNYPEYEYYTKSPNPDAVAYGHASCNGDLLVQECIICLSAAKEVLLHYCYHSTAGQVILGDCRMRYYDSIAFNG